MSERDPLDLRLPRQGRVLIRHRGEELLVETSNATTLSFDGPVSFAIVRVPSEDGTAEEPSGE